MAARFWLYRQSSPNPSKSFPEKILFIKKLVFARDMEMGTAAGISK